MAAASEDRCAICLDAYDNEACVVPCLHRFCFNCIRRWTASKPECPLCKRRVISIRHSLRGDEFEEWSPVASSGSAQAEGPSGLPAPTAPRAHPPRNRSPEWVGGLYPRAWAQLFRRHPHLLQRLRPWLRQELGRIFGEDRSQALMLEHVLLCALPVMGLNEEELVQELQADLQHRARAFVHGLIEFTVQRCGREAHYLLIRVDSRAGSGSEDSSGVVLCSAGFRRWRERSPVGRTSWAAYQERRQGNLVARTSSTGFQERGEGCLVTNTSWVGFQERGEGCLVTNTSWVGFQERRERSPVASTSWAAFQGGRELSPVAGTSRDASQGERELSPEASTSRGTSQEERELSPEASTSHAASPGESPAPGPALSSSAAAEDADQLPGTSSAALQAGPSCAPSVPAPIPGEQEEDAELEEAAAGASAPSQGRSCSCQGPRCPLKRKASSSEDSAAPTKKPPRR
ncbi:E3 ubiquitin-protein ligase Topors-like [Grus japonensis]|uniref:RING-type E3 ubiquitin transferase n=1 Tax=Grus japonensis TaxID=30415 RepID=A0ABC9XLB3_GRUJA